MDTCLWHWLWIQQNMFSIFHIGLAHMMTFICYCRISFPLPSPWKKYAGRPCPSTSALRRLWTGVGCLPGGLPPRQHHSGAAALYPHHPAGELVLAGTSECVCVCMVRLVPAPNITLSLHTDWVCAVPSQWPRVGLKGSQQHDVYHHVLLLAPRLRHARCERALLHCQLVRPCSTPDVS